ncbi:hypothetical protein F2Q69_00005814 [Brassica cretica]|uniref:Uncharacterized protein n=1 Tax=Brassica cretica TaxID=69181 RepID=A0A8S9P0C5_BRACR|nr:hypothetical protein F2Q69_00005814 [Brassica cretica]
MRSAEGYRITPDPRQNTGLWVSARRRPGSPLGSIPGPVPGTGPLPPGNGKLPIKRTFHISKYGRVQLAQTD